MTWHKIISKIIKNKSSHKFRTTPEKQRWVVLHAVCIFLGDCVAAWQPFCKLLHIFKMCFSMTELTTTETWFAEVERLFK